MPTPRYTRARIYVLATPASSSSSSSSSPTSIPRARDDADVRILRVRVRMRASCQVCLHGNSERLGGPRLPPASTALGRGMCERGKKDVSYTMTIFVYEDNNKARGKEGWVVGEFSSTVCRKSRQKDSQHRRLFQRLGEEGAAAGRGRAMFIENGFFAMPRDEIRTATGIIGFPSGSIHGRRPRLENA